MKAKKWVYPLIVIISIVLFNDSCKKEAIRDDENIVQDIDGNVYHTVTIGTQTWLLEDLKTTHYRNGDPIANITDNKEWSDLTTPGYCNYENDSAIASVYGRLYNWYAMEDIRNIAPEGWHVPSNNEWIRLKDILGGAANAGGKLKETDTIHWKRPNADATNLVGFTALPAGCRVSDGTFVSLNISGHWWRTGDYMDIYGYCWYMSNNFPLLGWAIYLKQFGFQVRCIKD
jgi:uncharacterized protein (TIGR02145 family)